MSTTPALLELGTHVHHAAGPISVAQLLPGMHVRIEHGPRTYTGRLNNRVLYGLVLHTDATDATDAVGPAGPTGSSRGSRAAGGQVALTHTCEIPMSSWRITLLEDFEDHLITPGTCAVGTDKDTGWHGLWLCDYGGNWEAARSNEQSLIYADENSLRAVQLHQAPVPPAPPDIDHSADRDLRGAAPRHPLAAGLAHPRQRLHHPGGHPHPDSHPSASVGAEFRRSRSGVDDRASGLQRFWLTA